VEEYIREFERLQIRSGIEEEPEQTMARFLRGLEPSIAEKVDIQPYWYFEDVCKQAIKVEKYLKGKGSLVALTPSLLPHLNHTLPQNLNWLQRRPEAKTRVRPWSRSFLSSLMAKGALNVQVMGISKLIVQTGGS